MRLRVTYNAPVTLTFALVCTAALILDGLFGGGLIPALFTVPGRDGFSFSNALGYPRLVSHVIGHGSWRHLVGNFSFILLLGPMLEEKHGSGSLLFMMLITALVTGLVNVLVFTTGILGASGIVFMMILLASFSNFRRREIPLTFLLILLLYLTGEVINGFQSNNVSEFAHITGGLCGSLFGFLEGRRGKA